MKIHVDREADGLYLRLNEQAIIESEEVRPGVILDFNAKGEVVGVEMLRISTRMQPEEMRSLHFATA
ncbi:MAG: DUF2283 domain-containing protein [Dehalococcoidia bacterium]